MDLRKTLLFALGATLLTTGCPGRDDPEDAGTDGGCIGVCTADGGQDAGPNPCAGVSNDGGTVNLYQLRELLPCGQIVTVPNVVVHSITRVTDGGNGSSEAEFYVGAPDDAGVGIFVHKFFNDNPRDYSPLVGDKVNLKGFRYENYVTNGPGLQHTTHRFGYRHEVGGQFYADGGSGKLQINFVAEGLPVHVLELTNRAEFAAADGIATPHDELRGARVHIPGPLYITDEAPSFMLRYNHDLTKPVGEQVFLQAGRDNYEGYVLTDGIVLADTFIRSTCNYRRLAVDAGGEPNQVVFPDGISGVWDSYTMVPFYTCPGNAQFYTCVQPGFIPREDGGVLSNRINVIWPTDCNDVDGGQLAP